MCSGLGQGDGVLLFNGRDGEWQASLAAAGKRTADGGEWCACAHAASAGDLHFLFAPLKHARLDYMVQKAVEMGASLLQPVITRHTQVTRINLDRMRANVIEAAEQCGILGVPVVAEPMPFDRVADDPDRLLVFCDEDARGRRTRWRRLSAARCGQGQPLAVLIGPEGGFAEDERVALLKRSKVVRIALGPAFCAPIRPQWRRLRWYRPYWGTGEFRLSCRTGGRKVVIQRRRDG